MQTVIADKTIELDVDEGGPTDHLPVLTGDDTQPPDDQWTNGSDTVSVWHLGDGWYLYADYCDGQLSAARITRDDIAHHLTLWAWEDQGVDLAEWLTMWSLDGLQVCDKTAGPGDTCRIWCEPCYYEGTCDAPTAGYVRDQDNEEIWEGSYDQAQAWIDEYYDAPSSYDGILACNVLSHGQAGPDTLTIVRA